MKILMWMYKNVFLQALDDVQASLENEVSKLLCDIVV